MLAYEARLRYAVHRIHHCPATKQKDRDQAMIDTRRTVIVISAPAIHKASLQALLDSAPAVQVAGIAGGCFAALTMVQDLQPDFILIAADLPEKEVLAFLESVQGTAPKAKAIVLRSLPWRQARLLDAGASAVLSLDSTVSALLATFVSESHHD